MGIESTYIGRKLLVYYGTYVTFPASGAIGDLAYATDRLVLYRWSGAAWQPITTHASSGLAVDIPTAANLPNGSLYFETDTLILKQVQAGAWAVLTGGIPIMLVANFQSIPSVGDGDVGYMNDTLLVQSIDHLVVGNTVYVLFTNFFRIRKFRYYGYADQTNLDGRYKAQYRNTSGVWTDYVLNIPSRGATWSNWDSSGGEVVADGFRFVSTALETAPAPDRNSFTEVEVKY